MGPYDERWIIKYEGGPAVNVECITIDLIAYQNVTEMNKIVSINMKEHHAADNYT